MAGPTQATDMSGRQYGLLTVLGRAGRWPGTKLAAWRCRCECGREKVCLGVTLRTGRTRSCGCLVGGKVTHGQSGTPIYARWMSMWERCTNPKNSAYPRYGGRGIRVCKRWKKFEVFLADMGECPAGLTLERIDNGGPYAPENCRWATRKEQANNRRSNARFDTPLGKLSMAEIAEKAGISYQAVQLRVRAGLLGASLLAPNKRPRRSTTSSTAARANASP